MGIEPTYPAWKAGVLPLNYTRMYNILLCQLIDRWYIITFILWCQHFFYNKCPVPESNQRHEDFQSSALPTELTGQLIYLFYLTFLLLSRHCSSQIVRHSLILLQFTASFAQNTHTGLTISRTCTGNIAIYVASSDNVYSQNLPLINVIPANTCANDGRSIFVVGASIARLRECVWANSCFCCGRVRGRRRR